MMPWEKWLLDTFVKPTVDKEVATLKTERDANIAILEADAAAGGATGSTAVVAFLESKVKSSNPLVSELEALGTPLAETGIAAALTGVEGGIPEAYDAGVAFLEKVDSEV